MIFGANFNLYDQVYKNPDPGSGIVLKIKKDELGLDFKYAVSNFTILGSGFKQIKQSSNDSSRNFNDF